jgi:hypothetical protein
VLWSGPVMSGMPCSSVPYHMNCCGCVKLAKIVTGYCWSPRSGYGITYNAMGWARPPRMTSSVSRSSRSSPRPFVRCMIG